MYGLSYSFLNIVDSFQRFFYVFISSSRIDADALQGKCLFIYSPYAYLIELFIWYQGVLLTGKLSKSQPNVPGEGVYIHQIHPILRIKDEVEPGVLYG